MSTTYNLADLFESVADVVPDRPAVITPGRRLSFGGLEERANRLADHLLAAGVQPGDHIALLLLNGTEYLEATFAAFKVRAVPVNVNYRYVERELQYLLENSDSVALVVHRQFLPRIAAVIDRCPRLRHVLVVDDDTDATLEGSVDYETALAQASGHRPIVPGRSGDDLYIAYTGGTTGLPKGVMWRHEDLFFAALGGGDPTGFTGAISAPSELPERVPEVPGVQIQAPPLMHVSALWGSLGTMLCGNTTVLLSPGRFDPVEALATIEREAAMIFVLVGDAMARPLADAIAAARGAFDLSSLFVVASGGAILSPSVRDALRAHLPDLIVIDGYGSSETGVAGTQTTMGDGPSAQQSPTFQVGPDTVVLDDDDQPVTPGSGVVGRLARRGRVPIGYYKDEEKSRSTFVEIDGERWVLPGDMATLGADGTITLLGRGSGSINTGGEKVFPEEVESVLKAHPDVFDTVVVGVPDERWGNKVVAVIAPRAGARPTLEAIRDHCHDKLAGYKVPRDIVLVDEIERNPNGKPDYAWAAETARAALVP